MAKNLNTSEGENNSVSQDHRIILIIDNSMVRVLKAIELLSVSIFSIDLPPKKNKLGQK